MRKIEYVRKEYDELVEKEIKKTQKFGDPDNHRLEDLIYSFISLKTIVKGEKVKVTYNTHDDIKGLGTITIIGKKITFDSPVVFREIGNLANNFEVYSKTNNTVQMNYAFYGLINKSKE